MPPRKAAAATPATAAAAAASEHFRALAVKTEGGSEKERGPSLATFEIADVDLCVVNALRRAVMADVPTVAIAFEPTAPRAERAAGIQFFKNTGVLHNEFLGHRVSMVPLGFDEHQIAGFDPALYKLVLKVKNKGDKVLDVTTRDFQVLDQAGAELAQLRDQLFPPSAITGDHVLLARLKPGANNEGEEISLEARARLGTGREHARWSPVSRCFLRYKVDPAAFERSLAAKLAAAGVAEGDEGSEAIRRQHAALDGQREYFKNEHGEASVFEFEVKSETRLRPAYLVLQAFRALSDRVRRMRTDIEAIVAGSPGVEDDDDVGAGWGSAQPMQQQQQQQVVDGVTVNSIANMDDFYEVTVRGDDHTLGNMVQGLLYRHWVREGGAQLVSFIGYHMPHPLEGDIVFKVKCAKAGADVRELLIDGLAWVLRYLRELEDEWAGFTGQATKAAVGGGGATRGWAANF